MDKNIPDVDELFAKVRGAYQSEILTYIGKTVKAWHEHFGDEQLPDFETDFHKIPSFSLRLKNARETYFRQLDITPLTSDERDALWRQAEMKLCDLRRDLAAISDVAENELKKEVRSIITCWFDFSAGLRRLSPDAANEIYAKLWTVANGDLPSCDIELVVRKFKELLFAANYATTIALDDAEDRRVPMSVVMPPCVG